MISLDRDYDIDFNEKDNCYDFYIIKEHFYRIEENIWSIEAYLLGRLYKKNRDFVLKVLNGISDETEEKEINSFENMDDEQAKKLSKRCLDLFLV